MAQNQKNSKRTLSGKTWQSQDTTMFGYRPTTFVFGDGTFSLLEFIYSSTGTLVFMNHVEEGTFKEQLGILALGNGIGTGSIPCKFAWISDTEFSVVIGVKKMKFALQGSPEDHFTERSIIPYLKKAIVAKEITHTCYDALRRGIIEKEKIAALELAAVKQASEIKVSVAITPNVESTKRTLIGRRWRLQSDHKLTLSQAIVHAEFYKFGIDSTMTDVTLNSSLDENGLVSRSLNVSSRKVGVLTEETSTSFTVKMKKVLSQKYYYVTYEIEWLNDDEFIFKTDEGGLTFALFESDRDIAARNYPGLFINY